MAFARVHHLLHLLLSRLPVASVYVLASLPVRSTYIVVMTRGVGSFVPRDSGELAATRNTPAYFISKRDYYAYLQLLIREINNVIMPLLKSLTKRRASNGPYIKLIYYVVIEIKCEVKCDSSYYAYHLFSIVVSKVFLRMLRRRAIKKMNKKRRRRSSKKHRARLMI